MNSNQLDINDISDNISTRREIEQLREMLEEKDRHITDLTDTLTHFHVSHVVLWMTQVIFCFFFFLGRPAKVHKRYVLTFS